MITVISRRTILSSASLFALLSPALLRAVPRRGPGRVAPVPARNVTLKPSPYADAMAANRRYLLSLDPERLLHNFYVSAGLPAPAPIYGGWESESIAGHTLGHWMSAMALMIANSGDPELTAILDRTLASMQRIQAAGGDGYLGGMTVLRDGRAVPGKIVFEELRRGDIRTTWELNGAWVPIYALHKIMAGLIDAHRLAGRQAALPIVRGIAAYFATIVEALSDDQVQRILSVEHGGILESYAELHALTGDPRWRAVAERLRHHAIVDPLVRGQDRLAGLHANTQIPKIIGLARLHELTGNPQDADAARFFHRTVLDHHSYVIGGNSEREHFGQPDRQGEQLTTATCEACNSYNMLKLTRHLYSWSPSGDWFDYYERTQINHMLAHQRPDTGQFVYFMPMEAGARRDYSTPDASFWCCVGSGMESHAKHADSIYWHDGSTLFVNLFIPSTLDLPDGMMLDLDTAYPQDGAVTLTITRAPRRPVSLAIRRPAWADGATIALNGGPVDADVQDGYWRIGRRWRTGDRVAITIPMTLRAEPLPGAPDTCAYMSGPLALAADLGAADARFDGPAPALLMRSDPRDALIPQNQPHRYRTTDVLGQQHRLMPFYPLYDRRAAVYFRTFTPESWARERTAYQAAEAARADLARRTIDIFHIGEMQPERDHALAATAGASGEFYGRKSRTLPEGAQMRFTIQRRPGPATLQIIYWGNDTDRMMRISVDGREVAVERRERRARNEWLVADYPLPPTQAAQSTVTLTALKGKSVLYGVRSIETR
ncbi:glycoside hydrolase family 127 protein [Sphingobium sp. HBC34]|uniref:Glycoside hydrolase family 127 protein n=1 Tax=Sphingobium cyanobacteriorum TaxID=3063954 RepID=A0ABT8ZPD7_9SPHN|nr:glycoside hydrolase family 127 protein [Sphingobium sp. HBC34]MDO7836399.1 glycoside hydrolase family 127 protein [Sphingobium sp. HBC34]